MPAISTVAGTQGYGRGGKSQDESSKIRYIKVSNPNSTSTQWIVKYTTDGNILWRALISGGGGTTFTATGVAINTSASTSDPAGNIYVVGYFSLSTVIFYNADATFGGSLNNIGGNDAFLVKYNRSGIVKWIARIISSTQSEAVTSVATDTNGNVYVGGSFLGTVIFYDTTNIAYRQFVSAGLSDAFVAKLNSSGVFQWIGILSAPTGTDRMGGIVADPSGNVYVASDFSGTSAVLTVYNGVTSTGTLSTTVAALPGTGGFSGALIKYNSDGVVQWRARYGGSSGVGSGSVTGIVANAAFTRLYMSITFNGNLNLYNPEGTTQLLVVVSATTTESAIISYDSSGLPLSWTRNASSGADSANDVAIDSSDNLYLITNQAAATTVYDRNDNNTASFTSVPIGQLVIKYNFDGYIQWVGRFTNTVPTGIACDSLGNTYVSLHNTAQFVYTNPSSVTTSGPVFYGTTNDMALVKLDSSGNFVWSTRIASVNQSELSMGISSDSLGNMVVMGTFATVSSSPNSMILYNADNSLFMELPPALHSTTDVFLAQYTTLGIGRWVARIGSFTGTTTSRFITAENGHVYVIGQYSGIPLRATGSTSGDDVKTINVIATAPDHFMAKYNSIGQTQWIVRFATTLATEVISNIKTDSSGNVYVGVYSTGTITFYGSDNAFYTLSPTTSQIVVIKYNSAGIIQWYVRMTNSVTGATFRFALVLDSADNLIVTGLYEGTLTFVNSDGLPFATTLTNAGSSDGFLAKYTSSGVVTWITRYSGTGTEYGTQVDVDSSNNIYIAGLIGAASLLFYNSSAPNGASAATLTTQSSPDAFVVKYNSSGTYQWSNRLGGTGTETATGIAVDNGGNSYLIATYTAASTTTFPSPSFTLPTPVGTDIVIIKYNTSGVPQWYIRVTGAGTEASGNIACDKTTGNVYFVGQLGVSGATIVDASGSIAQLFIPDSSNNDGFLAAVNTSGSVLWSTRASGVNAENITGVDVDSATSSVVITGTYTLSGAWACATGY